ncbi:endoribonuclease Dcr-1-like, partial [Ostrinia furnacalis]|uniref:endoribonuclease Dcr-1-like n=1 Tax=Ostrinia furnacalis TaxID=93504 RepID=UPI00103D5069
MMETCCSRFTAAEGGARLAAAASEKNIMAVEYSSFIATRLVHEDAYKIRGPFSTGRQRSVFICRASRVPCVAYELQIMTDLKIAKGTDPDGVDWAEEMEEKEVLVCTSEVMRKVLEAQTVTMPQVNVLIVDSCHLVSSDESLQFIMKIYKNCPESTRPRILALTYPLFSPPTKEETPQNEDKDSENDTPTENDVKSIENVAKNENAEKNPCEEIGVNENLDEFDTYEKLEWKIEELEKELCCEMDLAEDIDGGKRLAASLSKPKELVIEYSAGPPVSLDPSTPFAELDAFMRGAVNDAMEFIMEHRYDPTEIYGEDMYEEFKNIPDPTIEPKFIFKQFLYVLDELGPYAADKAAFSLLAKLEKLKIKVPYERHFLLLCLCTSVFVKIRGYADYVFSQYESDWEKIKIFCTPKVLRFAEILLKFQPPELVKNTSENTAKMLSDIEQCDFASLGNKIEDKVNSYEANLKDLEEGSSKCDVTENEPDSAENKCDSEGVNSISAGSHCDETSSNKCDVQTNSNSAENKSDSAGNTVDSAVNKTDSAVNKIDSAGNKPDSAGNKTDSAGNKTDSGPVDGQKPFFSRRSGGRVRGRGRLQRTNIRVQQIQQNPDALCGIVFMKEALMAKIMFMLIV